MNQKITAIFNGKVFCPMETFNLEPNTKVTLTVELESIDDQQLRMMAYDPEIIKEISAVNQEFMMTEMDGLREDEH